MPRASRIAPTARGVKAADAADGADCARPPPRRRIRRVTETVFYLASSFWLGAVHAATPGHGKTISAAYIVGARGRPVDALVLGIFVTLSHTSSIILVGVLATMGSAWLVPQRVEAYLGVATGLLVIGMGAGLVWTQPTHPRAHSRGPQHGH